MIYKYILTISGDSFLPGSVIDNIAGDFVIDDCFSPTDRKFENTTDEYGYGGMSFWHPLKFSVQDHISEYEALFLEFLENNCQLFIQNGADELQISIEIYHEGGDISFEILNKDIFRKLGSWTISVPISVYVLEEATLKEWEAEIQLSWQD